MSRGYMSQCAVKTSYDSKEEAERNVRRGAKLFAYGCLACGKFHLSHKKLVKGKRR